MPERLKGSRNRTAPAIYVKDGYVFKHYKSTEAMFNTIKLAKTLASYTSGQAIYGDGSCLRL